MNIPIIKPITQKIINKMSTYLLSINFMNYIYIVFKIIFNACIKNNFEFP